MLPTTSFRPGRCRATLAAALTLSALVPAIAVADPAGDKDKDKENDKQYSCAKQTTGMIAVTFKPETELKDLIAWVMGFTCKNFIVDPRIVSTGKKVTVIAPLKMTPAEAYDVFLAALSTMQLTVVPKGNVMRIVEAATAKNETVPIIRNGIPADQDQIVRYVLRPSYGQTETIRQALDAVRSTAGNVQAVGNLLIITDYASQVRDMLTLAKALDVPGNNDGIYTIPVLHADAQAMASKINDVLGLAASAATPAAGGKPGTPNTPPSGRPNAPAGSGSEDVSVAVPSKILVDEHTNTLIVVASEAGYLRVKGLVQRLDISLDTEGGSAIHVVSLENALAEELATVLNNAMQGQAKPGTTPGKPGTPGAPATAPGAPATPGQNPDAGSLGAALEGQVRVIGDKATNSLIVVSTGRDFLAIRDVIRRLDQPRKQVFIEAMILEIQLSDETDVGTSSHGGLPTPGGNSLLIGGVQTPSLASLQLSSLLGATGLIGGVIGAPLANSTQFLGTSIPSYGILFQALANQANTNILSEPHLIAIDNEDAKFSVGNNIPYQAGLSFGGIGLPGGTTGASSPVGSIGQNIQREDLNLEFNIKPHISGEDQVRLEIEQNDKDEGAKDPQLGPTWTERKLKTQVVVHDQESVVIGGLIQDRDVYSVNKVPVLGDIPLLGYLFKYTTKTKAKTNLLILLTPYIIKDPSDLAQIRERKQREYDEYSKSFANLNTTKYQPKVDYKRKRGLVEEINRSVQTIEEEADLRGQVGRRQHVQEGPIEYLPSQIEAPDNEHDHDLRPGPTPTPAPATPPPAAPKGNQ
jgi:general secretion pathway protein D